MRKILVLRGGALGDLVVTLPALATLRHAWPRAQIELAGNATAAALARPAGLLDAVHSQHEARWGALHGAAPLAAEFAAWLAKFDLVLNFWPDADGQLARHFPRHPAQVFLSGPSHPVLAPAAAHYSEPLRALGLTPAPDFFPLGHCNPAARLIAVHPGSGSPRKNWPLERHQALCEWLQRNQSEHLLIITGEAESEAARALARFGTPAHDLPLAELIVRLASCRLSIGHDSGISHLAAACGVPCILLFGPTDPTVWAPPAPHVTILQCSPDLAALTLTEVQQTVLRKLRPRPMADSPDKSKGNGTPS